MLLATMWTGRKAKSSFMPQKVSYVAIVLLMFAGGEYVRCCHMGSAEWNPHAEQLLELRW